MISEKAMLSAVHISIWTATKHDKKVSQEVASKHNAPECSGRYNKQLLGHAQKLEDIRKLAAEIRQYHYQLTLPWTDEGYRILPSELYFDHAEKMRHFQSDFNEAAADFICEYPLYVEAAKLQLNGLFREEDYPASENIRKKFQLRVEILPIPSGDDFRVSISNDEQARIRHQIDESVRESFSRAHEDLWIRLRGVVERMVDRLRNPDSVFRDSLVGNVVELVEMLPKLNIAEDGNLDSFVSEVKQRLCEHSPDELRRDQNVRESTAQAAADIMARMSAYMGTAQ